MGQMISKVATLAAYFMKDLSLGQVKSPHHSDQVCQRSSVSLCRFSLGKQAHDHHHHRCHDQCDRILKDKWCSTTDLRIQSLD